MAPIISEEVNAAPTRYLLKFESFSVLSANGTDKHVSSVFQSSGYKWKMIIYPNGDGSEDGKDHISMYLAIAETGSLHAGWEVNATFSFLIFDQIHDKYTVVRGMTQRFQNIKTKWGYPKCISHEAFKKPSNGYLVNDECIFGVDVSVIKNQGLGECVSLLKVINSYKHEWKISEFSKLKDKVYSEEFLVGEYKWKLLLYPAGNSCYKDHSISIYLVSVDASSFDHQKKVQAIFSVSVKDQNTGAHRVSRKSSHWCSAAEVDWGWSDVVPLSKLQNPKNGYVVEDCCILEADVSVIGVVNGLT